MADTWLCISFELDFGYVKKKRKKVGKKMEKVLNKI